MPAHLVAPPGARIIVGGQDAAIMGAVREGLIAHNDAALGARQDYADVAIAVQRDGEPDPAGGLIGHLYAGWLWVQLLYVPADLRGAGLGRDLLHTAEAQARARGCLGAYLDTFSFQARGFYERQGYSLFGTLPDCPLGHARHFLAKRFSGAPLQ